MPEGHRIANPESLLPADQSDDCLLVEWDGGWDTADDLAAAHALAKRLDLGADEYSISVNEIDGEMIYEGGAQ